MSDTISYYHSGRLPEAVLERVRIAAEEGWGTPSVDLERQVAEELGVSHVLSTSSSTNALHLAMCALDLKRADKVVCPVYAYADIPEVVRHFDAEPIFVDCEPFGYTIDPKKLEEVLKKNQSKKLRAVIVNHVAGFPADLERIYELARKYNVAVIEDLTDAPGTRYRGKPLGTMEGTLMGVASLGNKIDNHFDAGLLLSNDDACYERGALLRNHAKVPGSQSLDYLYDIVDIGCQYRLNEFAALYAQVLFSQREEQTRRRMEIAEIYFRELKELDHVKLPFRSEDHTYYRFMIEIDRNRDAFARGLLDRGVETALHYVPLHMTQYYKEKYGLSLFDFPWAMGVFQRTLSLPNRPDMSDEEVMRVCEAVRNVDAQHV